MNRKYNKELSFNFFHNEWKVVGHKDSFVDITNIKTGFNIHFSIDDILRNVDEKNIGFITFLNGETISESPKMSWKYFLSRNTDWLLRLSKKI